MNDKFKNKNRKKLLNEMIGEGGAKQERER